MAMHMKKNIYVFAMENCNLYEHSVEEHQTLRILSELSNIVYICNEINGSLFINQPANSPGPVGSIWHCWSWYITSPVTSYVWYPGQDLVMFKSYLTNRFQIVSIHDIISDPVELCCGVSQSFVFEPILFTLYT